MPIEILVFKYLRHPCAELILSLKLKIKEDCMHIIRTYETDGHPHVFFFYRYGNYKSCLRFISYKVSDELDGRYRATIFCKKSRISNLHELSFTSERFGNVFPPHFI